MGLSVLCVLLCFQCINIRQTKLLHIYFLGFKKSFKVFFNLGKYKLSDNSTLKQMSVLCVQQ